MTSPVSFQNFSNVAAADVTYSQTRDLAARTSAAQDLQAFRNLLRGMKPANDNMPLPWWLLALQAGKEITGKIVTFGTAIASSEGAAVSGIVFLLGAPIGFAVADYLQHPGKYPAGPRRRCGEAPPLENLRSPEWQQPPRPLIPPRQDYRNPRLTDAERRELLEWVQPEKHRGNFTGPEGRPLGLPQDPRRDDSYGAPAGFRNAVVDVPRPNAMPLTEIALPDLQQNDDRRRLIMRDTIPGHTRAIGDFSGVPLHEQSARDFLAPQHSPDTSPRFHKWLPDIRMDLSRGRLLIYAKDASSLQGLREVLRHMKASDFPDAGRLLDWMNRDAVTPLPDMDRITPYVLSLMVDDAVLRYGALESFSPQVKGRWDVYRDERHWDAADPVQKLRIMTEFVRGEEAGIGTRSCPGPGKVQRESWEDMKVPAAFADAVRPVVTPSGGFTRAADVARIFADFLPLDDFPPAGHRDHRWDMSMMTAVEKEHHVDLLAVGRQLEVVVLGDGRWLGCESRPIDSQGCIAPALRFFVPIEPHYAADIIPIMNAQYRKWAERQSHPSIQWTMTTLPGRLSRANALVVSAGAENQEIWRDLAGIREAIPEYFRWELRRPSTSAELLYDNDIRTGIFVAESRHQSQDSGLVTRLAGAALSAFRNRVLHGLALTPDDLIRAVAYEADRAGIDLERPAFFKADSRHPAGWQLFKDVFRRTD